MMVELRPCRSQRMRDRVRGRTADRFYFELLGTALKAVAVMQICGVSRKASQLRGHREQFYRLFRALRHKAGTMPSPKSCNALKIALKLVYQR